MTEEEIGRYIRDRRVSLKLSLEYVANQLCVSKSTVSRWETGSIKSIKRSHIYQLAKILQIPIEIILGLKSNKEIEPAEIIIERQKLIDKINLIKSINDIKNVEKYIDTFIIYK